MTTLEAVARALDEMFFEDFLRDGVRTEDEVKEILLNIARAALRAAAENIGEREVEAFIVEFKRREQWATAVAPSISAALTKMAEE